MIHDVVIVGAGPAGSSAATFLARQGLSVLLLDKAHFPRDKVCGDGLTPQAIVWLDVLGCADEVLGRTNSCITSCDLFIDGEHALTARFPQDTPYPGFGTCLERKKLDHILLKHAVAQGAVFMSNQLVRKLRWHDDRVEIQTESTKEASTLHARLVIGADGAASVVSRSMGNVLRWGTKGVFLRAYYHGVKVEPVPFRIYVSEHFFPGYGWIFVDDGGQANVGFGYVYDRRFSKRPDIAGLFSDFVGSVLKDRLGRAALTSRPAGWWTNYSTPASMVADRVMLIGDAANLADPLNGAGIHMAVESAYVASQVAGRALAMGDCSREALALYERLLSESIGLDRLTSELFLSLIKNPHLRELYFMLLKALVKLTREDQGFRDFCSGIFCGLIPQSTCLSPLVLLDAVPLEPRTWSSLLRSPGNGGAVDLLQLILSAARKTLTTAGRIVTSPLQNLGWGAEVLAKTLHLAGCCGTAHRSFRHSPAGDLPCKEMSGESSVTHQQLWTLGLQ